MFRSSNTNDHLKIFLSNLDGRVNNKDLEKFFQKFGPIDHIESLSSKSAVILYSNIDSVNRVLAKYRKCTLNRQEIYIRRIRYGYIERAYMDSPILFIKPTINHSSIEWTDTSILSCFHQYDKNIQQIRIDKKRFHASIQFDDYDIVDRILLQSNQFQIDDLQLDMSREKLDENQYQIEQLIAKNKLLKRQIKDLTIDSEHEIRHLKHKIKKLRHDLSHCHHQRSRH